MRLKEVIGAVPFSAPVVKFFRRALQRHSNRGQVQINSREGSREAAWVAYLLNPQDRASKLQLARFLRQFPFIIDTDKKSTLLQLLRDQEIDPDYISLAGWFLILKEGTWVAATKNEEWDVLAAYLDDDEFGLSLLRETPVYLREVEHYLSNLRRWLVLETV
jgi:hypothetical protein